jgi:hypothetical protein
MICFGLDVRQVAKLDAALAVQIAFNSGGPILAGDE